MIRTPFCNGQHDHHDHEKQQKYISHTVLLTSRMKKQTSIHSILFLKMFPHHLRCQHLAPKLLTSPCRRHPCSWGPFAPVRWIPLAETPTSTAGFPQASRKLAERRGAVSRGFVRLNGQVTSRPWAPPSVEFWEGGDWRPKWRLPRSPSSSANEKVHTGKGPACFTSSPFRVVQGMFPLPHPL